MIDNIINLIDNSSSILLLTHESPDGDAVGSVLAFYHYLTSINKNVDMVIKDIPKVFNFLSSINKVVDRTEKDYDLGIVLDCASFERIGQNENLLSKCKKTLCVDHHISNTNYCNFNLVEGNISSCCQVVYYLFKKININFNKDIGEALICGMLTDTNGFSVNTVDKNTFKMAADIVDLDIDIHSIYDKVLCKKSMPQYELMKIAMGRLEFFFDGKIAWTYVLKEDFDNVGAGTGEHEGIVNIGRNIDGVEVSVFVREDDGWTISLRSNGSIDVSKIAASIGGGGHFMAAGGKLYGSLSEIKETIINKIKEVI